MNGRCRGCWPLLATCFSLVLLIGCGQRPGKPIIATVAETGKIPVVVAEIKLEIDPALTKDGLVVAEKRREGRKMLLAIRRTIGDHESTNYSYILYDAAGKELSSSRFSGPGRKQDEDFEVELAYDDMPTATRIVIAPFRPLKSAK
ncbi:MAG: hypothetical protein JNM56_21315 [Planctomycetia bacterium]|nr:hypothetical protein [Planctomycetia bacterium]